MGTVEWNTLLAALEGRQTSFAAVSFPLTPDVIEDVLLCANNPIFRFLLCQADTWLVLHYAVYIQGLLSISAIGV